MDWLVLVLSGLMGLGGAGGWVGEHLVEDALQGAVPAETWRVRLDAVPTHGLLAGRVSHLWIVGRGVMAMDGVRLAELEVETDALDLRRSSLGGNQELRTWLEQPLRAAAKVVITESDLNGALQSPGAIALLKEVSLGALGSQGKDAVGQLERYTFRHPQVQLLGQDRLGFTLELQGEGEMSPTLRLRGEVEMVLQGDQRWEFRRPQLQVNGIEVPGEILRAIALGLGEQLDLQRWAPPGLLIHPLHWRVTDGAIHGAVFLQLSPAAEGDRP